MSIDEGWEPLFKVFPRGKLGMETCNPALIIQDGPHSDYACLSLIFSFQTKPLTFILLTELISFLPPLTTLTTNEMDK